MRNKATLAFLTLFALAGAGGCGGGDTAAMAEFERYDGMVSSLLEEEALLRTDSTEAHQEAVLLNRFDDFEARVRHEFVPAYERMGAQAVRAKPGNRKLAETHGILVKYLSDRVLVYGEFLEFAARAVAPAAKLDAALRKVVAAGDGVEVAMRGISEVVTAEPTLVEHANDLFKDDPVATGGLLQRIRDLQNNRVIPAPFLKFLAEKVEPWYASLEGRVGDAVGDRAVLHAAARKYVAAGRALVREMRALTLLQQELNPYIEREVKPRIEAYTLGIARTDADLKRYRESARAYRAAIRD